MEEVQSTLQKVSDAKNKVVGFVEGVKKVVDSVSGFFDKIKDIIANSGAGSFCFALRRGIWGF